MAIYFLLDSCPHKKSALIRSILVGQLNDPLVSGQKSIHSRADTLLGRKRKKCSLEDEMIEWHHQLNGHGFEQAPGVGDGQGNLASCSPWGHKESDMTEQLN